MFICACIIRITKRREHISDHMNSIFGTPDRKIDIAMMIGRYDDRKPGRAPGVWIALSAIEKGRLEISKRPSRIV